MREVLEKTGAGEGNRTLVFSLEGCCSTIELHPRRNGLHAPRLSAAARGRRCFSQPAAAKSIGERHVRRTPGQLFSQMGKGSGEASALAGEREKMRL